MPEGAVGAGRPSTQRQAGCRRLPDAHWSALSPGRPLRRFRLLELGDGDTLADCPLRIDERVLHFLLGVSDPDQRLDGLFEPVELHAELPASHQALFAEIVAAWSNVQSVQRLPVIELCGPDSEGKRAIAAAACAELGLRLHVVPAQLLGASLDDALLALLLSREAMLTLSAVLLDCEELEPSDSAAGPRGGSSSACSVRSSSAGGNAARGRGGPSSGWTCPGPALRSSGSCIGPRARLAG